MKIGQLDLHCGNCKIIDHCGEPYSDICICSESRFENVEEDTFLKLIETSTKKSKKARINDVYKRLKNSVNGLTVYFDGDGTWYASPWELEKTRQWIIKEYQLDDDLELEECDIEKDGMWCETNDKKDIDELGDYDESCKGGLGDLRRGLEDNRTVEKVTSFKEVLTMQGVSKEPYIIATTNY